MKSHPTRARLRFFATKTFSKVVRQKKSTRLTFNAGPSGVFSWVRGYEPKSILSKQVTL